MFLNLSRLGPCGSSILTDVGLSPVLVIQVVLEIRPRHLLLNSIFSIPQSAADVSRLDHLTPRAGIDPCAQDYRPEACSGTLMPLPAFWLSPCGPCASHVKMKEP